MKGAALIDSVLMWPLLGVSLSVFMPPPQQEDTAAAGVGAATGTGCMGAGWFDPPEQHDPPIDEGAGTGADAAAGPEQQEPGAAAGTSRSTGSVVTCNPRATRSW